MSVRNSTILGQNSKFHEKIQQFSVAVSSFHTPSSPVRDVILETHHNDDCDDDEQHHCDDNCGLQINRKIFMFFLQFS